MKKILFILTICLLCSISVFSQSKKKWEQTQSLNSTNAYLDFISEYPQGKYVEEAKQKLAQLEFAKAKQQNTIAAYEDFIKKTSNYQLIEEAKQKLAQLEFAKAKQQNTVAAYKDFIKKTSNYQLIEEAKHQIAKIQEQEEFSKVKDAKSVIDIFNFLGKYPNSIYKNELKQLSAKISYEKAISNGTSKALESFVNAYPNSEFADTLFRRFPALKYSESMIRRNDQALISFIQSCSDPQLIKDSITKLKTYQIVDISKTIPWADLKTVYSGSVESNGIKYLCGINLKAFYPAIDEISIRSVMVGPKRYYEPDAAKLRMYDWTEFDGYFVKSTKLNHQTSDKKYFYTEALVRIDGLLFEPNSIVLKKIK